MKEQPILYLPHGGGPLPLLGDPNHTSLVQFLQKLGEQIWEWKPKAILVISAHWEEKLATLDFSSSPELIFDYSGFPAEAYQIEYPVLGSPSFAQKTFDLLTTAGLKVKKKERGLDHGVFVPLKVALPDAQTPIYSLSLLKSLNPSDHIEMGKAIADLRQEGVLIIGSGMSFHNMQSFFNGKGYQESYEFDKWLQETLCSDEMSLDASAERLTHWLKAPFAKHCHPREEHLLPLHVCFGAAYKKGQKAKAIFDEELLDKKCSGFIWE